MCLPTIASATIGANMALRCYNFDRIYRFLRVFHTGFWMLVLVGCAVTPQQAPIEADRPPGVEDPAEFASLQGNYEEAIRIYQKRLAKNPADSLTLYHMGYAYGQLGDHHREIHYYEKAIASGLHSDQVYSNLGMAFLEMGQSKDAVIAFKRSLKINANNADAHFGLGLAHSRQKDRQAAERALKRAIELDPQFVYFRENLAKFYEDNKQWSKAAEQYESILEIDPENELAQRRFDRIVERLRLEKE